MRTVAAAATALLLVGIAGGGTTARAEPAPPAFACNRDSTLTLLGLDSAAGTAVFAAPPARAHEPAWWIEVEIGVGGDLAARYRPMADGPRPFAGSVGPGPVFAARRCGEECLQPVRYRDGDWRPLGSPVAADGATVHGTYDRSGRPWLVLHRAAGSDDGAVEATAYRLDDDERWQDRGTSKIRAAGTLGAVPDPHADDSVLSGTGRFSAGAPPTAWVSSLPKLAPERRGELVPAGAAGGAALLDTSYALYTTGDDGGSWQRQRWTPWGSPKAQLWQPGRDYWLDLPAYDRNGPLALAWFDRRRRDEHRLVLTAWEPGSGWRTAASLPPETRTLDGAVLSFDHLLRPAPDRWVLLSGCVMTASGPGVATRTVGADGLSSPRFLPLVPAADSR